MVKCNNDVTYLTEDKSLIQECLINGKASNAEWSQWSPCSATCGVGYRYRTRKCSGKSCPKNVMKSYQWCRTKSICYSANSVVRVTAFLNNSQKNVGKFTQATLTPYIDDSEIKIESGDFNGNLTEQGQVIMNNDEDLSTTIVPQQIQIYLWPKWAEWESWTDCSNTCGNGVQYAKRKCLSSDKKCKGSSLRRRVCNVRNC